MTQDKTVIEEVVEEIDVEEDVGNRTVPVMEGTRELISKPVSIVSGCVERKLPKPILGNFLLEKKGQNIVFTATDLNIQVSTSAVIGAGNEDFATTISAKKFADILSSLKDNSLVSISCRDEHALINSGKSKFELQTLPADQFPSMKKEDCVHAFSIPCMKFKYLLSMVSFAAAENNIRYFLNGVFLHAEDNIVGTVATDGHRLALCDAEIEEKASCKVEVILPRKTVRELLRLIPDTEELLSVSVAESQIKISFAGVEVVSKLVEGRYPDYLRVVPTENDKEFSINRDELHAALTRVAILTADKLKGVRWLLSADKLKIEATNIDMEIAEDELDINYNGKELEIGFNVSYILDALNVLKNETVRFSLGGPLSSALMRMPESDKFKYVVMPMKI